MSDSLEVREPVSGAELFVEPYGERRIPIEALVTIERVDLLAFQRAVTAYMSAHPKLEVCALDSIGTNELVIRWRWRR